MRAWFLSTEAASSVDRGTFPVIKDQDNADETALSSLLKQLFPLRFQFGCVNQSLVCTRYDKGTFSLFFIPGTINMTHTISKNFLLRNQNGE